MKTLLNDDGFFRRIVSNLLPPRLGRVKDHHKSVDYQDRLSRSGVENHPKFWFGRIVRES